MGWLKGWLYGRKLKGRVWCRECSEVAREIKEGIGMLGSKGRYRVGCSGKGLRRTWDVGLAIKP